MRNDDLVDAVGRLRCAARARRIPPLVTTAEIAALKQASPKLINSGTRMLPQTGKKANDSCHSVHFVSNYLFILYSFETSPLEADGLSDGRATARRVKTVTPQRSAAGRS